MKVGTQKVMADKTTAYLTQSKNYFCRREPKEIVYYTLEGSRIYLAKGKCKKCKTVIESKMCGDFVSCPCGKSFVDTDRWSPERHRFGGEAVPYEFVTTTQ